MTVGVDDICKITATLLFASTNVIQNVYHVKNVGAAGVDEDDFASAAATWLDDAYTEFNPQMSDEVTYLNLNMYNITNDVPIGIYDWPVLTAGVNAGYCEPLNVAYLVAFQTGVKKSVGRKYFGGFSEANTQDGGVLDSVVYGTLGDAADILVAGFVADTQDFVAGNYREDPERFAEWTGYQVRTIAATQRRRRIGVGI